MNWEIQRHDWEGIASPLAQVPDLLEGLLRCRDTQEANQIYWRLDALLVPNGVLRPGAPEVTSCLVQLLPYVPGPAREWVLELLSQFASGASNPTAAAPDVVDRTAQEILWAIPVVAQVLQYGSQAESLLSVDILEICFERVPSQRRRIQYLFGEFGKTGEVARKRVEVSSVPPLA